MNLAQHIQELAYFLAIVAGPVPSCLGLVIMTQGEKGRWGVCQSLLVLLTSWCVIGISLALLLGIAHVLTAGMVLTSELILFLGGCVMLTSVCRRYSFRFRDRLKPSSSLSRLEILVIGTMSCVGGEMAWRVGAHAISNYDSLMYHLPAMAQWYQTGTLRMLAQFDFGPVTGIPAGSDIGFDWQSRFPYNWEALCTLFLFPFKEDFLVAFPNLLAWSILGLSIYLMGRRVGATRLASMTASALVLTLPIIVEHVVTMHVDLPMVSFFMAGLYLAIVAHDSRSFPILALFLVTLGALAGIKSTGLIYAGLIVVTLVLIEIRARFMKASRLPLIRFRDFLSPLGVASLTGFVLLGGFWYARNIMEIGNPIGYVPIEFGGVTLFPGKVSLSELRDTSLARLFDPANAVHWNTLARQVKIQLHVPFLVMVLQVLLIPLGLICTQKPAQWRHLLGLGGLVLATGVLYWTTPYSGDNGLNNWEITQWIGQGFRYGFPVIGVLGVFSAASSAPLRIREESLAALVVISSVFILAGRNILPLGILLLVSWGLFANFRPAWNQSSSTRWRRRWVRWITVAIVVIVGIGITFAARRKRETQRHRAYGEIYEVLSTRVAPNEPIGYLLSHRSYLFYGKTLERRVTYVPAQERDLSGWVDLLRRDGISVVAIGPFLFPEWESSKEVSWLRDPDGPFFKVFGEDPTLDTILYRLKPSPTENLISLQEIGQGP